MTRRLGLMVVLSAVASAVLGPAFSPHDPFAQDLAQRLAGPSWSHPLGLDELGRDLLTRLLAGARTSLFVGCAVVGISAVVGVIVGALAGFLGGRTDAVLGRVMDVLLAFPGILLAIALVAVLGPSLRNVVLALVLIGWVGYARLVRGQVLKIRELEYVQAARALGAPILRVLAVHVVPATFSALSVQATLGMGGAVIAEASLSFLGLGVQPPHPSWGTMLDAGRTHLFDAPHLTLVPGLAIATLVLGFNFVGESLRERLDRRA